MQVPDAASTASVSNFTSAPNPYRNVATQPNPADLAGKGSSRAYLTRLSNAQRILTYAMIYYFTCLAILFAIGRFHESPGVSMVMNFLIVSIPIVAIPAIFNAAAVIRGKLIAVIYACSIFLPLLGLAMMGHVNSQILAALKKQGVKIGFLGAKLPK